MQKKNYWSTQITIKRGIKMTAQKKLLRNISNETSRINSYLDEMDGQLDSSASLIADIERFPVSNITFVKKELIEKKLHAVYRLIDHRIENIKETNHIIKDTSEQGIREEAACNL